jgi:hypothetical protein
MFMGGNVEYSGIKEGLVLRSGAEKLFIFISTSRSYTKIKLNHPKDLDSKTLNHSLIYEPPSKPHTNPAKTPIKYHLRLYPYAYQLTSFVLLP